MIVQQPVSISEFCETGSGTTPSRQRADYYEGAIPWVKSGELRETVITATEEHVTEKALAETSLKLVPPGAVLVAMYGATVGRVGILGIEATTNQAVCHIVPDPQRADTRYMFHAFQYKARELIGRGVGGAQPNISQGIIKDTKVYLPPLDEQRRIAAILDQVDALRRARRRAIDRLNGLGQAIFYEMFGDPVTNPKGYEVISMESLLARSPNFGSMVPPEKDSGEWLSLRVANIQNWELSLDDLKYIDLEDENDIERHTLADGDIILARAIASQEHLGKCVVVYPGQRKWAFDSHIMRIRLCKEKAEPEYIRDLFRTKGGRAIFLKSTRKTTVQYNINTKELRALSIPVPSIQEQREYIKIVERINRIKEETKNHLVKLDTLFSSLQNRAFRGEL